MSSMAKIWRNRVEGGTQKTVDCPSRYYDDMITLITQDYTSGKISKSRLETLVENENITPEEYKTITGEDYEGGKS